MNTIRIIAMRTLNARSRAQDRAFQRLEARLERSDTGSGGASAGKPIGRSFSGIPVRHYRRFPPRNGCQIEPRPSGAGVYAVPVLNGMIVARCGSKNFST